MQQADEDTTYTYQRKKVHYMYPKYSVHEYNLQYKYNLSVNILI